MSDFNLEAQTAMDGSAIFARDRTIRREIRRWWVPEPLRWAAWLMLNPSNAAESRSDPTAACVTKFSRSWGFDGWIGVNLYPFISSHPTKMWKWADWEKNGPDWCARDDLHANLDDIERVGRLASIRIAAFGATPIEKDQEWLGECIEAFSQPGNAEDSDDRIYCIGVNKNNQPIHPLARGKMRVPDDTNPIIWA